MTESQGNYSTYSIESMMFGGVSRRAFLTFLMFLLVDAILVLFSQSGPSRETIFQASPKRHFRDSTTTTGHLNDKPSSFVTTNASSHVNATLSFVTLIDVINSLKSPVIMTTVNHGFMDLLQNLLFSIQRISLKNDIVVICEDRSSYLELSHGVRGLNITYHIVLTHLGESVEDATTYGSKNYKSLVKKRVLYLKCFVDSGVDVLYTDVDIVLLGDPFPYFERGADLVVQTERSPRLSDTCTGFMFMKASKKMRVFLDAWSKELPRDPFGNQRTFNKVIGKYGKTMKTQLLPMTKFQSGKIFRDTTTPWREREPRPVEVHANFLVGHGKKTDMLKEADLWFIPESSINVSTI